MLTIFIDRSIVHIQASNTVVQGTNLSIMSLYTVYRGKYIFRVEYSVER